MPALGVTEPPAGGIDVDLPGAGIRLSGTRWAGAGTPVVLLHGLASQRRFWNLVVPHLVTGNGSGSPVLALDQRGHGDSDRPPVGYDATTVAGDLAVALDALGWSRAVVVGHSWGGSVAATFAAEHGERTLALVAIDGGFASPLGHGADREAVRKRLEPPKFAVPPDELVAMLSSRPVAGEWTPELAADLRGRGRRAGPCAAAVRHAHGDRRHASRLRRRRRARSRAVPRLAGVV
jgi:pimeloyl-ACP methyl ester carboxylesterase